MFNQDAADWVEQTIAKSDNPELLALMVVSDVLFDDISKNQRAVDGLVVDIHKRMFDGIEKMHKNGRISKSEFDEISKDFWDGLKGNLGRDAKGRFKSGPGDMTGGATRAGAQTGRYLSGAAAGFVHSSSQQGLAPKTEKGGYDLVATLGQANQKDKSQFADDWGRAANKPHSSNARTYGRIEAGSKVLGGIGVATGNPGMVAAGAVGQYAGKFGPEAEKVFGPSIRRAMYRYRGIERTPEKSLLDAEKASLEAGGDPKYVGHMVAREFLNQKLPEMRLAELQRTSGRTTPSEGIIIDAKGQISHQAFGHADDHYLPFNLANMKDLKGGEYLRTRTAGGLTSEDIYAGLMSGAKRMTVLSNSGEFTLEFADDLRGARRHGSIARTMTDRYKRTLDTIQNDKLTRGEVPADVKAEIRQKIEQDMPAALHPQEKIDEAYTKALQDYQQSDSLTQGEMKALDQQARVTLAQQKISPDSPDYDKAFQRQRVLLHEQAQDNKRNSRYQLNGDGYATAMEALREQYPYFIKDVSYQTRNEKTTKVRDGIKAGTSRATSGNDLKVWRDSDTRAKSYTLKTDKGFVNANEERPSTNKTAYSFDRKPKTDEAAPNAAAGAPQKPQAQAPAGPNTSSRNRDAAARQAQAKVAEHIQKLPFGTLQQVVAAERKDSGNKNAFPVLGALVDAPESELPYVVADLAESPEGMSQLSNELAQVERKLDVGDGAFQQQKAFIGQVRQAILGSTVPKTGWDPKRLGRETMDFSDLGEGFQLGDGAEKHQAAKQALAPKAKPLLDLAGGDRTLANRIVDAATKGATTAPAGTPEGLRQGIEAALTNHQDTVLESAKALGAIDYLDHIGRMEGNGGASPKAPAIPVTPTPGGAVSAPTAPSTPAKPQPSSPDSSRTEAPRDEFTQIYDRFAKNTVGQEQLKQSVKEFAAMMSRRKALADEGHKLEPMDVPTFVMSGAPGTGKTSSANALGEILHAAGVTESPKVTTKLAGELTGTHVGDAAALTAKAVQEAKGGVLLVDEAHALLHNQYGQSVASALVGAIQPGSKTAVILAGYPGQMDKVVALDPGMERRVSEKFALKSFSGPELRQITQQMLQSRLSVPMDLTPEGFQALGNVLAAQKKKDPASFGNAGAVLKELKAAERRHAVRVGNDVKNTTLDAQDFQPRLTVKRASTLTQKTLPDATETTKPGDLRKPAAQRYMRVRGTQ